MPLDLFLDSIQDIDLYLFQAKYSYLYDPTIHQIALIWRNKLTWIPLYITLLSTLYYRSKQQVVTLVVSSLFLIALSDLLCAQVLKDFFMRSRPCHLPELQPYFHLGLDCSQTFSFPSCHAMNHIALASLWTWFFRGLWEKIGLWVWAVSIGLCQFYIGVHYLSDVLSGFVFGYFLHFIVKKSIIFAYKIGNLNFSRIPNP
ncbi:MAG: phosphatase PAP2 family protein [Chitinophagales bacterium]|jgi:undecaprenyl-diphosphatase|nr:phosphatase PAP2 family protein [Chitinophagales bacterium]